MTFDVQIVTPAHNEGESIGETLVDFLKVTADDGIRVCFIVSEDGSSDNTCEVVMNVANRHPVQLLSAPNRKGYSRAVIDGLKMTTCDVVGFIDSDGQCDPSSLKELWRAMTPDVDLVIGYRHPRNDPAVRKAMSCLFRLAYQSLFPVRLKDPSSPYLLIRRVKLEQMQRDSWGILTQGFWWEFYARANAAGLRYVEVPVRHRPRSAGRTQVYRAGRVTGIAIAHLRGLFVLRAVIEKEYG